MCINHTCKFKDNCYRYKATPNDYQSYGGFTTKVVNGKEECSHYWPLKPFPKT